MSNKEVNWFGNMISEMEEKKHDNTYSGNTSSVYISNRPQQRGGSCLLLVDPQTDFVTGSLAVTGAVDDCKRIASFIKNNLMNLQEIYVTMDTHMNYHIAHPMFWRIGDTDKQPSPFTPITLEDIDKGKYRPADANMKSWVRTYAETLQNTQRLPGLESFVLTIWPPHCLIGTPGHCVEQNILEALQQWEKENNTAVHYIIKGNNSKTEHYSAFRAEVLVKEDKATEFNERLLRDLERHSKIYVAGEAKSHCVNFTVRDLVQGLGPKASLEKIVLLDGGMSSVTGCDAQGDKFWNDMTSKTGGVGLSTQNLLAQKHLNV